jgi:predicted dehydrogenase
VTISQIRLGLIGAGKWGKSYISTISQIPNVSLSWIVSTKRNFKDITSDCKITSSWRDMLNDQELDGIIFSVPPLVQGSIALDMMAIKKVPLLLEKPLALDCKMSKLLIETSREFKVYVQVNHIYLFHPAYRKIFTLLHLIGNIKEVYSIGGNLGPFRDSHSPLWDWMPHDISMCMKLIGTKPRVIFAKSNTMENFDKNKGEIIKATLEFESGVEAHIICGNGFLKKKRYLKIIGENGTIIFDDLSQHKLQLIRGGDKDIISFKNESPLGESIGSFVNSIIKGNNSCLDLEFSGDVISVLSDVETKIKCQGYFTFLDD